MKISLPYLSDSQLNNSDSQLKILYSGAETKSLNMSDNRKPVHFTCKTANQKLVSLNCWTDNEKLVYYNIWVYFKLHVLFSCVSMVVVWGSTWWQTFSVWYHGNRWLLFMRHDTTTMAGWNTKDVCLYSWFKPLPRTNMWRLVQNHLGQNDLNLKINTRVFFCLKN